MIGFAWGEKVRRYKKRRENKNSSMVSGLSHRKDEAAIYLDGENLGETGLGTGQLFGFGPVTSKMPCTHLN